MRLDRALAERGYGSRSRVQELIKSGAVSVGGKPVTKPAWPVPEGVEITVSESEVLKYVSRGGLKLEAALNLFGISPAGLVCVDLGASTGGFTDCLLRHGAAKVYAVDAGSAQLHESLRADPRVVSMENCNARYLTAEAVGEPAALVVMDVSFISQTLLFPTVRRLLSPGGRLISLIKPQFEVGREEVGKGGIVREEKYRRGAVEKVCRAAEEEGFTLLGKADSPLRGGDGNREYLAAFCLGGKERE